MKYHPIVGAVFFLALIFADLWVTTYLSHLLSVEAAIYNSDLRIIEYDDWRHTPLIVTAWMLAVFFAVMLIGHLVQWADTVESPKKEDETAPPETLPPRTEGSQHAYHVGIYRGPFQQNQGHTALLIPSKHGHVRAQFAGGDWHEYPESDFEITQLRTP